jgi:glycosyltransferase involved in cell wall biosynthesis
MISLIRGWGELVPENPLQIYATKSVFDFLKKLPLRYRVTFRCVLPEELLNYEKDFDVYFIQLGYLRPIPPPKKTAYHLPDLQERFFPEFFSYEDIAIRTENHEAGIHYVNRLVTGSEFCRKSFIDLLGVSKDLTAVVHLPVADIPRNDTRPKDLPADLASFAYFPADDYPHKNHRRLFQALGLLKESGSYLSLVCTGGRFSRRDLTMLAKDAGLEGMFWDLGKVSRENVSWLYRNCRAVIFPSLFEGFGLPVLEAFSLGAPILCSGVTSLPELGGDAAIYVNPFDAYQMAEKIKEVWNDASLRKRMISMGGEQVKKFSLKRIIRENHSLFSQIRDEAPRNVADGPIPLLPLIDVKKAWELYRSSAVEEIRSGIPSRAEAMTGLS